jgi:hypothetical protein
MTYHPTAKERSEVETMTGLGFTVKDIATVKGMTINSLRKHFAAELKLGVLKANIRVANKLYHLATRDNASAAAIIWWEKTRGGRRELAAEPVPGKKEQADLDARDAERGTEWAGLLQ